MTELQPVAAPPPGWYADPATGQQRWWDGQAWGPYAAPSPVAPPPPRPVAQPYRNFATWALVLGILAMLITIPFIPARTGFGLFFTIVPGALGIVFGAISRTRAHRQGKVDNIGTAGMVIAILALLLSSGLAFLLSR